MVFAPVPRDYSFKLNKKERRAALKSALTSRVQANKLIVVDAVSYTHLRNGARGRRTAFREMNREDSRKTEAGRTKPMEMIHIRTCLLYTSSLYNER